MKIEAYHTEYVYSVLKANLERGIKEGLYRNDLNPDIVAKLYVGKTLIVVDEEVFPLKEYNRENLYKEYINYHIHGVASPKGLEVLHQKLRD